MITINVTQNDFYRKKKWTLNSSFLPVIQPYGVLYANKKIYKKVLWPNFSKMIGLVSLFNSISTFVAYLMPKPFS